MATMEMFKGTGGPVNTVSTMGGGTGNYLTDTAELWGRRKSKSEEHKETHQGEWSQYWRWYLNWKEAMSDPQDWWRSNVPDPEAFKIIETLLPNLILGMFQSQEWFTIKGRERNDAELARKIQSLLMYMADRMDLFPKLYECLKYALIMGHAWGKVTWRIEMEDRIRNVGIPVMDDFGGIAGIRTMRVNEPHEVYNDPWFEWLMLDKVWCDPTGQGRWYIEQIETTLDQLKEVNEQLTTADGKPLYKNLGLVESMGDHTAEGEPFDEEKDGLGYSGTQTQPSSVEGTKVLLSQCWGWVPPDLRGPDGAAYRLTVIANGLVEIRDEPIPTPDNRPPYFPIKTIPIPGRLFGGSILKWVGPQIDVKSRLANMRVDEVTLGIWQQFLADRDAVTSNQMLMQPGGVQFVDTQGGTRDIRTIFAPIERTPHLQDAYVEDGVRQRNAEDTAAATNLQQGVADSSRQSATEIMSLRSKGDARFVLQTMWLDATAKKQILERGFKYYQKQLPPNRLVRIIGTDYEDTVDISEIQAPHDIIVDAGIQAFTREARIQSVSEFVQLANSEQFGPWFKKRPLLKQLAEDRGWVDVDKFVVTEEEFQQQQENSMRQQVQMAQLEKTLDVQGQITVEQAKQLAARQAQQQDFELKLLETSVDMRIKEVEAQLSQIMQIMELEGKNAELDMQARKLALELDFLRKKQAIELKNRKDEGAARAAAARTASKSGGKGK